MEILYFVGWDISKDRLNYCVRNTAREIVQEDEIANKPTAIKKLCRSLAKQLESDSSCFLHCAEHTGQYTNPIRKAAIDLKMQLWLEDGLQLKYSKGRDKDKTDRLDARYIAEYCQNRRHRAVFYEPAREVEVQLDTLSKMRLKLVRKRQSLKASYREMKQFTLVDLPESYSEVNENLIKSLNQQIKVLEKQIKKLIFSDEALKRIYKIALSVPGVGRSNVLVILSITGCFKRIKTAKACASYAGISPHPHQSGSSVRRKSKTSKAASRQLKTAFHQGLMFTVHKAHLPYHALYTRLRQKGRSYNQAMNAARNKMIRILYACITNDVMYDKKHHGILA